MINTNRETENRTTIKVSMLSGILVRLWSQLVKRLRGLESAYAIRKGMRIKNIRMLNHSESMIRKMIKMINVILETNMFMDWPPNLFFLNSHPML